jgi:putative aldouronate transport system permease protein
MKKWSTLSMSDRVFQLCNYVIFTLFMVLCIFPFYYIFINTISANNLVDRGKILFIPIDIHLTNYIEILKLPRIGQATWITVARTLLGTTLCVLSSSYLGYLFTKENMWMRKFWYRFVIITMYFSAGLIPGYLNIKALGLYNSFWVYIIPGLFPVFHMILVKTYIEQIPSSLEESAQIDGAGFFVRFFLIILPLCIPILATIAVYNAVDNWNSFMDTVLYVSNSKLYTLQFLLYQYLNQADAVARLVASGADTSKIKNMITPTSVRLTMTIIITVPILLVYPFLQRFFIKGLMLGAVKG